MNNYFNYSSTNNNHHHEQQQTDYNCGNFRLTNSDSSFVNMMQTATTNIEQYQSQNDYFFSQTNGTPSSFSMSVTNPMLYYTHPWMRPGIEIDKLIRRNMIY